MNITLIYPLLSRSRARVDENKQYWPPLGLAYIAAVLEKASHHVQIIDRDVLFRQNDLNFDKTDVLTLEAIKRFKTDLIGISATTPNMSDVKHISGYVKDRYKESMIVLGGPHPSGEPVLSLEENPSIDVVAQGEGEFTMRDIADGLLLDKISGITYRSNGTIVSNTCRKLIENIDDLPMPARHLLDMKFYTRPSRFTSRNLSLRTTSIFTARGCPYRCSFCAGPLVFEGKVRFHSSGRVMAEIDELISKYSVEALYFAEDMFLSSRKRAEELLSLFIENGINKRIKWFAQAKASIITEDLLRYMKEAGCVGIEYGFESGSQRVLDLMNKRQKVEESLRAAALARKAGMRFQANIIVGYPGEKEDDFRKTIEFIKAIKPNMIGFNIFMPLPGTPSYEMLKKENKPIPSWDDIGNQESPQFNYADMPEGVFEKLYIEARLKVILPMNLRNFIKDNINNPLRLLKVGSTQFNGVLLKALRSIFKLALLKVPRPPDKKKVLFLSYNGLLEPILPSQAIPYMRELAKRDFEFILVTYEKKRDIKRAGTKKIKEMKRKLRSQGIEWVSLRYHKNPPALSTLFDLVVGSCTVSYLIVTRHIRMAHIRGITPGLIMLFLRKVLRVKMIFDMRGLLAEEYAAGGLWKEGGLSFKLVKKAERNMLKTADAVTVLTNKHLEMNKSIGYLNDRNIPMDVVPCCVDLNTFKDDAGLAEGLKRELGLDGKFVLMYPGKVGTFYLMKEMLDFYKVASEIVPDSIFFILTNDSAEVVRAMARRAGISESRLRISKGVSFSDMPRYVRIADAGIFLINPYKKLGSSPIKLGEFLASGVPVIINPGVGDSESIVAENRVGAVVRSFGESCYKNAINEILTLKKEGTELKQRCRATAAKYLSLEAGVDKYYKIYEELLKR